MELEERVLKLESITNEMYSMVRDMHRAFVPPFGQKSFLQEQEMQRVKIENIETELTGIKNAHAKDRAYVIGGASILAFLFSIFGDIVKKMIGL